jgi:AcrR family transcriptional regulator
MNQLVHQMEKPQGKPPGRVAIGKKPRLRTPNQRVLDAERTQADIVSVAALEFGEKGLAGARIDAIAAATKTSKRMLYYYFGSKEGLYLAALEHSYRKVRDMEVALNVDNMEPLAALRCLVVVNFDHHLNNENYIRMVMSENINRGRFLAQSPNIQALNRPAISTLRDVYERGVAAGVFRSGLDPADIHASISALAFFNMSNRHTFGMIFQLDNQSPAYIATRRENVVQMILRYVSPA